MVIKNNSTTQISLPIYGSPCCNLLVVVAKGLTVSVWMQACIIKGGRQRCFISQAKSPQEVEVDPNNLPLSG